MAQNDEELRLVLQTVGTEGVERLRDRLQDVQDQAGRVAAEMGQTEGSTKELDAEFRRLSTEAKNLERALGTLEKAQAKFGDGSDDLGKKSAANAADASKTSQAFVEIGRVYQDVAQGGLASAANNVEGLTRSFVHLAGQLKNPIALLGGWPGILTAVGTAAVIEGPRLFAFFKGLVDGTNEIPKATGNVEGITEALKANEKQLDNFRGKQSLTNTELETYVRLTAESVKLTERKVELEKQEQALKDLRAAEPAQAKADKAERAGIVQTAVDGRQKDVAGSLGEAIQDAAKADMFRDRRVLEGQIDQTEAGPNRNALQRQLAALNQRIKDGIEGRLFPLFRAQAEKVLSLARQGDQAQIDRVLELMASHQDFADGAALEWIRRQVEQATPKGLKDRKDERHFVEQQAKDAKLKRDLDKLAADKLKGEQDDAIKVVTQSPDIEALADTLAKAANAKGLDRIEAFETVRDAIVEEILSIVKQRGVDVAGADKPARAVATGIAERAFGAQDQGVKAAAAKALADDKRDQAAKQRRDDRTQAEKDKDAEADFKAATKQSGVGEQAENALAQIQRQGGVRDRQGKVVPMDAAQQQAYVRQLVEQFLHRQVGVDEQGRARFANPNMPPEETGLVAQRIVSDAADDVRKRGLGRGGRPAPAPAARPARGAPRRPAPIVARPHPNGFQSVPPADPAVPNLVGLNREQLSTQAKTVKAVGGLNTEVATLRQENANLTAIVTKINQDTNGRQRTALRRGGR